MENSDALEHRILRFGALLTESLDFHGEAGHGDVAAVFSEAISLNYALHRRLTIGAKRYVVGFVGLSNVGKSTLLNALLGSELTPRRNGPCTTAPIEFERDGKLQIRVSHERSFRASQALPCKDAEAVHAYLDQLTTEDATGQREKKVTVLVPRPFMEPILDCGVVIADTPGFGSTATDSAAELQESKLRNYVAKEVAQVFWVVLADQGVTEREAAFYHKHLQNLCDDIVVTGAEDWSELERARFVERFSDAVMGGRLTRQFHFVSGRCGLEARSLADPEARAEGLQKHGITALENRLIEVASGASRLASVAEELDALIRDLQGWLQEYRNDRGRPLRHLYAPSAFERWGESHDGLHCETL